MKEKKKTYDYIDSNVLKDVEWKHYISLDDLSALIRRAMDVGATHMSFFSYDNEISASIYKGRTETDKEFADRKMSEADDARYKREAELKELKRLKEKLEGCVYDREDLLTLIKGTRPSRDILNHAMIEGHVTCIGGFHDTWQWTSDFKNVPDRDLWKIYNLCKDSWKK